MTAATAFTAGDLVSMLVEGIKRIGVVERVYKGDYLFIRWEVSGNKKIRSWSWISSDWISEKYLSIIKEDESLIKQNRSVQYDIRNNRSTSTRRRNGTQRSRRNHPSYQK